MPRALLCCAVLAIPAIMLLGAGPVPGAGRPAPPPVRGRPQALRLEAGSVARHQLVALGEDLVVEGEALSDVAALQGSVDVTGRVAGQIIVLGGNVHLARKAEVGGDVFVLGGTIRADAGARLGGRSVSYPRASGAWLTLLEGPGLGLDASSPVVIGAKVALLAAWVALLLFLFAASGREMLDTSERVSREPFRSFFVGLTGVVTFALTALFLATLGGGLAAVPLLALVALAAVAAKLWGMVAVFHALGDRLALLLLRHRVSPLQAGCFGLLALGALKFLPYIGVWTWTAASLIGIGATLATKFGRREPWFELA